MLRFAGTTWLAVALLVFATPSEGHQRHKWWESGDIKSELRITDEQSESIEQIYQDAQPMLRSLMQALDTEEETLSALIAAAEAEEWAVAKQIVRVEAARGALSKERLLMIYRMHRELSVDQRAGLRDWMRANRRSRPSPRDH